MRYFIGGVTKKFEKIRRKKLRLRELVAIIFSISMSVINVLQNSVSIMNGKINRLEIVHVVSHLSVFRF